MALRQVHKRADGSVVELAFTERSDGNFHIDASPAELSDRRNGVMAGPWTVVRQVHGASVVDASVLDPEASAAPEADGLVCAEPGRAIAVQGADCAPLAFVTNSGAIGVAHAGWRGLESGIVTSVVNELASRGAEVTEVVVGPVICASCYEFGAKDLERLEARMGPAIRGVSAAGTPALDMSEAIRAECERAGVTKVSFVRPCTSCSDGGFSHRARQEPERHALVARIRP